MLFLRQAVPAFRRSALASRPLIARSFATTGLRNAEPRSQDHNPSPGDESKLLTPLNDIHSESDLLPPGADPGTVPTDLNQSTGIERLEILGKMQGVDVFDMRPLDASRKGTLDNPIVVHSFGDEQYVGCTGSPADSHHTLWVTVSRDRPIERCIECGSAYKLEYVGPQDDGHGHGHGHDVHESSDGQHNYEGEPKTMADFVRPEYR